MMTSVAGSQVAAAPRAMPESRAYVEMIMGVPFSVHIRGRHDPAAEVAAVAAVWAELRHADRIFSTFRPDSVISRMRRGELAERDAPTVVREVLEMAEQARRCTAGRFDVRYAGGLDPAGIVKGWAAKRAAAHLELPGVDWYLNAGGDVLLRSANTGVPWRVGIENPWDTSRLLTVVAVADGAVATSGRAHRGRHIVDPTTLLSDTAIVQATVCGPDLTWADVFATALVASGEPVPGWSLPRGYDCLLVTESGDVLGSAGMTAWLAMPQSEGAAPDMAARANGNTNGDRGEGRDSRAGHMHRSGTALRGRRP